MAQEGSGLYIAISADLYFGGIEQLQAWLLLGGCYIFTQSFYLSSVSKSNLSHSVAANEEPLWL